MASGVWRDRQAVLAEVVGRWSPRDPWHWIRGVAQEPLPFLRMNWPAPQSDRGCCFGPKRWRDWPTTPGCLGHKLSS